MGQAASLFPGQGAQFVGMGKDIYHAFPESKYIFDQADEVLGTPLSRLCFEGPAAELTETINAQPATFTMSVACLKAIEGKSHSPVIFVAGHSLGEYTALVAAGVVDFAGGLRLVRERGRLMQEAPQTSPEGMAAIVGLDSDVVEDICAGVASFSPGSQVRVVNYNTPKQVVASGSLGAVCECVKIAEERGAMLARLLTVSRAFHSAFMRPVAEELKKVLAEVKFDDARVPVISNITGRPITAAEDIKTELVDQVFSPVQWTKTVEYLTGAGVTDFIELGPGRVLTGLVKNTVDGLPVKLVNLGSEKAITMFLSQDSSL